MIDLDRGYRLVVFAGFLLLCYAVDPGLLGAALGGALGMALGTVVWRVVREDVRRRRMRRRIRGVVHR